MALGREDEKKLLENRKGHHLVDGSIWETSRLTGELTHVFRTQHNRPSIDRPVMSTTPCCSSANRLARKATEHADHRESIPCVLPVPYKAFLKSKGEVGEVAELEQIQKDADARFKDEAIERLLRNHTESQVAREPASLGLAIKEGSRSFLEPGSKSRWLLSVRRFSNGLSIVTTTGEPSTCRSGSPTGTS